MIKVRIYCEGCEKHHVLEQEVINIDCVCPIDSECIVRDFVIIEEGL